VVDRPASHLKVLAAYLAQAYGADGARIMTGSWAQAMRDIIAAGGDVSRSRAPSIACPTLLISGSADPVCPPGLVCDMASAIPRGTYLEVTGGHDLYQSHRGWLVSTVVDWLGNH
jgi:valacyclovir hydrolase